MKTYHTRLSSFYIVPYSIIFDNFIIFIIEIVINNPLKMLLILKIKCSEIYNSAGNKFTNFV